MVQIAAGTNSIDSINIDLQLGDKSGYLHLQNGQRGYLEYDEFSLIRSSPPVNMHLDAGAELWGSSDYKIVGSQVPAFKVMFKKENILSFFCNMQSSR